MSDHLHTRRSWGTGSDGGRSAVLAYAAVAALSVTAGVVGTWFALRSWPAPGAPPMAVVTAPSASGHEGMSGMEGPPGEHPTEAKRNTVYISPARQQLIGVRTAKVTRQTLSATLRTVGTLAYDETRMTQINTKIAGWVERIYVDYVGKVVQRGEPLLDIYSPALVATEREYLLTLKSARQTVDPHFPEVGAAGESLRAATRERLKLWDISDAQIAELERTGKLRRTLTLYAPFDGVVLERNAFAGQYIAPEMSTLKLADLSTVWVLGSIFEYELGRVKVGQTVRSEFPYGDGQRNLNGRITYIYPDVDPQTRRVKVRAEFPNPGLQLKPDAYVTLVISIDEGDALAVPKEAVIDTGAKRYVILAHPNGYFEPREIQVGPPSDDFYPVLGGIDDGSAVVTSALFLIDSETNLKAAMQAMSMSMPGMEKGGGDMEGMEMPAAKDSPTP